MLTVMPARQNALLALRSFFSFKFEKREGALKKFAESMEGWGEYCRAKGDSQKACQCFLLSAQSHRRLARAYSSRGMNSKAVEEWRSAAQILKSAGFEGFGRMTKYAYGMTALHIAKDYQRDGYLPLAAVAMGGATELFLSAGRPLKALEAGRETIDLLIKTGKGADATAFCVRLAPIAKHLYMHQEAKELYTIAAEHSPDREMAASFRELAAECRRMVALPVQRRISEAGMHYG